MKINYVTYLWDDKKKLARLRSDIECAAVNHFTEMNDMGFNIALKSNFLKLAII